MSSSTIRKAIGAVKDQTSIGIAKVASNTAPDLEVAIVKAMTHDDDPTDEKYIREILNLTSYSRGYVNACVAAISKRLGKTHDWIVALKALMLVHRLLAEGDPVFQQEILYATRRGTRLLNLSDFRDDAHSNSWDHSGFVRAYALYLDQKLECIMYEKKSGGGGSGSGSGSAGGSAHGGGEDRMGRRDEPWRSPPSRPYETGYQGGFRDDFSSNGARPPPRSRSYGDVIEARDEPRKPPTPLRDMKPERVLGKMNHLQRLLDRFLACRPTGMAKNSRMVLVALYQIVKESFQIYADICEVLAVLLDRFFDFEYSDCVKAFEAYTSAAKQIDELVGYYNWCKDTGVARSSEFPEVQRITEKLLETLEEFLRDRAKRPKSPERKMEALPAPREEEPEQDINEIKALPAPETYNPPPPPPPQPEQKPPQQDTGDLLNLAEDAVSAGDQSNRLALALFSAPAASNGNGSWEAFPSNGQPEVTSAWQNPAAETGKADWELALVETASNLSNQKAAMGGGMDPLLLNGMYDQGIVRQHTSTSQLTGGSASSVAILGPGKSSTPVLALPAPDGSGSVQTLGQDPFAASLTIPPPSYVQMAEIEKKQQLLMQEQQLWQQYARDGMQGQMSLNKIGNQNGNGVYGPPGQANMVPYGMPQPGGYYYTPY